MKIFLDTNVVMDFLAYQYQAALSSGCDCLITSNIKDFIGIEDPLIDILSPKSFCEYQ